MIGRMWRFPWRFWQVMSAVAHLGTLNASHCWCISPFYSCYCVEIFFSWISTPNSFAPHEWRTTRQYRSTMRIHGSTASVDLGLLCEAPQSQRNTLTFGRTRKPSDRSVAETSTWQYTTLTKDRMSPARLEPAIPVGKRSQTYNLDPRPLGSANMVHLNMKAWDECNFRCRAIVTLPSYCIVTTLFFYVGLADINSL
jgi:hypothetical protein